MKYILDFDHTLFDTSQFSADVKGDGLSREDYITPIIWDAYDAPSYLYSDVIPFLEKVGKENVCILTASTPSLGPLAVEFQKAKLERSGMSGYVHDIHFMVGDKGEHVASLLDGEPTIFVDNMLHQVQSVRETCPSVEVIQIVRPDPLSSNDHDGTDPTIKTITTLSEIQ